MPKLLIIDDHQLVAETLAFILETEGFDTLVAFSGEEGLNMISRHQPDVVICDYRMPDITGLEVLQSLRESPELAHTPFIMLTMDPSVRGRALTSGVNAFLTKSDPTDKLLSEIVNTLSRDSNDQAYC